MACNLSDLEAYYDRQLLRIGGIVEEALGIERQLMMLFEKILPIMQHHMSTSYRISAESYGGSDNKLYGTGQGNSLSGALCRDMSCLAFKYVEKVRKGVRINLPITNEKIDRMIIAFVDDTDFYTAGLDSEEEVQKIMKTYTDLHEATGGRIQKNKIQTFAWRWSMVNGEFKM